MRDGWELTLTAPSRTGAGHLRLLQAVEEDHPAGDLCLITDKGSSHKSPPIGEWLAAHLRVHQVFIPKGVCWLGLQEGWWRMFRREASSGQSASDAEEIAQATTVATGQLNSRAKPSRLGPAPSSKAAAPASFGVLLVRQGARAVLAVLPALTGSTPPLEVVDHAAAKRRGAG